MKSGIKGFWKKQKYVIRRHRSSPIVFPKIKFINPFPGSEFWSPSQWESFVRDFQSRLSRSDSNKSFNENITEHFQND